MIWPILGAVVIIVCMFPLGHGLKKDDDDFITVPVVVDVITVIVLAIIAGIGGCECNDNLKDMRALKANIPIKQIDLAKLEAEHAARDFNSLPDLVKYTDEHNRIENLREKIRNDIVKHNEVVAELRSRSPWTNPLVWLNDRRNEGEFIEAPFVKPEESDEPLYPEPADSNTPDPNQHAERGAEQ